MPAELSREKQMAIDQEYARVNLLYRNSATGVFAQALYSVPYCIASWHAAGPSHTFLIVWFIGYMMIGLARTCAVVIWRRLDPKTLSLPQIHTWLMGLR